MVKGGGGFHYCGVGDNSNVSSHDSSGIAKTGTLVVSRFGHQPLALVFNTDVRESAVIRFAVDTGGSVGAVCTVKIVFCLPTVPTKRCGCCAFLC